MKTQRTTDAGILSKTECWSKLWISSKDAACLAEFIYVLINQNEYLFWLLNFSELIWSDVTNYL